MVAVDTRVGVRSRVISARGEMDAFFTCCRHTLPIRETFEDGGIAETTWLQHESVWS